MRSIISSAFLLLSLFSAAQKKSAFDLEEVTRIEKILSADDMQGRKVFTPGIEKAAGFIKNEFQKAGLAYLPGYAGFEQNFVMAEPQSVKISAEFDGVVLDQKKIVALTADSSLSITAESNYKKIIIKSEKDFRPAILKYFDNNENVLILVDTTLAAKFQRLANLQIPQFTGGGNRIFVLSSANPAQFRISITQKITERKLTNLVGILPGKSKAGEYVIFSAHYDHLGTGMKNESGDSIYNGANDDASGTTAVIALANYFSLKKDNERTLIFVAFTAEEVGEFGSAYFSRHLNPAQIAAMINIEMIGTESKWGRNSAYITGMEESDLGVILQKNLTNSQFRFYPDPYPDQMLFLRSDNATLAKLGVPAHTISTSKMDSEKYYHQLGDEMATLDLQNMNEIIKAIALSATSLVSGMDTPGRVKTE